MLTRLEPKRRGQRHALRLAAAERAQRAIERQIAQPDRRPDSRAATAICSSIMPADCRCSQSVSSRVGERTRGRRAIFSRDDLGDVLPADLRRPAPRAAAALPWHAGQAR